MDNGDVTSAYYRTWRPEKLVQEFEKQVTEIVAKGYAENPYAAFSRVIERETGDKD